MRAWAGSGGWWGRQRGQIDLRHAIMMHQDVPFAEIHGWKADPNNGKKRRGGGFPIGR